MIIINANVYEIEYVVRWDFVANNSIKRYILEFNRYIDLRNVIDLNSCDNVVIDINGTRFFLEGDIDIISDFEIEIIVCKDIFGDFKESKLENKDN